MGLMGEWDADGGTGPAPTMDCPSIQPADSEESRKSRRGVGGKCRRGAGEERKYGAVKGKGGGRFNDGIMV